VIPSDLEHSLLQFLEGIGCVFTAPTSIPSSLDLLVHPSGSWWATQSDRRVVGRMGSGQGLRPAASHFLRLLLQSHFDSPRKWLFTHTFHSLIYPDSSDSKPAAKTARIRGLRRHVIGASSGLSRFLDLKPGYIRFKPRVKASWGQLISWPEDWPNLSSLSGPFPGEVSSSGFPVSYDWFELAERGFYPGYPTPKGFLSRPEAYRFISENLSKPSFNPGVFYVQKKSFKIPISKEEDPSGTGHLYKEELEGWGSQWVNSF